MTKSGPRRKPKKKAAPVRAERTITTSSAEETFEAAKRLGRTLAGDEIIFLIGELGAGKTVFAKGIAAGLGLRNIHQVCSPTFTIMNVYQARVPIYHFDLYRLGRAAEIRDLGLEDYIGQGVVIVEWAERMPDPLPAVEVRFGVGPGDLRKIEVKRRYNTHFLKKGRIPTRETGIASPKRKTRGGTKR